MNRIGVMQITDSLAIGGLERVAVNLANLLPQECYVSHLCATHFGGPLVASAGSHVNRLILQRRGRFDLGAIWRLRSYIAHHDIRILHAHGTSLFIAVIVKCMAKQVRLVWHDHFGRFEIEERSFAYQIAAKSLDAVVSVSEPLAGWARRKLKVHDVRYIRNFVTMPDLSRVEPADGLPGEKGFRIVCVANLRPQKDHHTLLNAFAIVAAEEPRAHLLLAGEPSEPDYKCTIEKRIFELGLARKVSYLGAQRNVFSLLVECDVAVLSSRSEGLPLALLEYGAAGLPVVATDVGQCAEVLDGGRVGRVVRANRPAALAAELLHLIRSPIERSRLGEQFRQRVESVYSANVAIRKITEVYRDVLDEKRIGI